MEATTARRLAQAERDQVRLLTNVLQLALRPLRLPPSPVSSPEASTSPLATRPKAVDWLALCHVRDDSAVDRPGLARPPGVDR
jgi:hypothetical protein